MKPQKKLKIIGNFIKNILVNMEDNIYYVYRHFKGNTTEVIYIGRSRTLNFKRAYAFQCNQRNEEWCKIHSEFGINVEVVSKNMSDDDSSELEEFLITCYGRQDLGTGKLVNKCNGGKTSKGMIRSESYRRKQSENIKGRYIGENNPFYNKTHSKEALEKMKKPREALKDGGHFRSREVINVLTGTIYPNMRIASEKEGVGYSSLRGYLRGAQANKTPLIFLDILSSLNFLVEDKK